MYLRNSRHRGLVPSHRPDFLEAIGVPGDDIPIESGREEGAAKVR